MNSLFSFHVSIEEKSSLVPMLQYFPLLLTFQVDTRSLQVLSYVNMWRAPASLAKVSLLFVSYQQTPSDHKNNLIPSAAVYVP
jgi:hypothetical protein